MLYNNLSCHLRDLGIGQIWSCDNVLPDGISPALRGGALAIRPELVLGRGADGEGPDCAGGGYGICVRTERN